MSWRKTRVFKTVMMLGAIAGLTSAVQAEASFSTFVSSTLEIITIIEIPDAGVPVTLGAKPTDLLIEGGADFTPSETTSGDAGASTSGSSASPAPGTSLNIGDEVMQIATINGFAIQPPDSSAEASVTSEGEIFLSNSNTSSTYIVVFELSYQYNVNADAENDFNDDANAEVNISLVTSDGLEFDVFDEVFALTKSGANFDNDNLIFTLVVPPSATDELTLFVNTSGKATSIVPEPATAMVFGAGIGAIGLMRRKR